MRDGHTVRGEARLGAAMGIVIPGAGPTGLGAAWRLQEHGHREWHLLEVSPLQNNWKAPVLTPIPQGELPVEN